LTEQHRLVAILVGVVAAVAATGAVEGGWVALVVTVMVAGTTAAALTRQALGGLVIGLLGAAALVGARQVLGRWDVDEFWYALAQVLGVVVVGVSAGAVGSRLRWGTGGAVAGDGPVRPALGLLGPDDAIVRLDEEVERARDHRRPVSLLLVDVDLLDQGLDEEGRRRALRAVARTFESRLLPSDVPFAATDDFLGAILPETGTAMAWDRVARVLDAVREVRFSGGADDRQRPLSDVVTLHIGLAGLGEGVDSVDGLFDAAARGLRRSRSGRVWEPRP
jgi:GGDEF domain-containing protein